MTEPGADPAIDISVVVVSYNTAALLLPMWQALKQASAGLRVEVIVVDNASRDDSLRLLRTEPEFAGFRLIENATNVGFGRANNQGVAFARGRHVLLLNTDAFVSDDSLDAALAYMDSHPECGVLGTHLVGRDGTPQPNCRYFPTIANIFVARSGLARAFPRLRMVDPPDALRYPSVATECDWVTGCFMLIRRDVVAATGLFDPRYFLYFEEVDFCLNAKRRGWKIVYLPTTRVVHLGGESAKSDAQLSESGQISVLQIESELLYIRKHFGRAGLLAHVCLCELADAMRACKSMLKRRALTGLAGISAQARNRRRILAETRWGTRPTR